MQCQTKLFAQVGLLVALGTAAVCSTSPVDAQIVPDATLGQASSQVRSNATVQGRSATLVEGGATRGAHLFHSFSDFNVGNRQRVYFANPAGVLNIFSRVTGNSGSNILGTLGVDGMANLYLLNPNGIVFGPNARLDVAGSFVASTANRLVFDDGQFFSAVAPNQPPLLQINVTPGLQYGNNFSATIRNQGNLQVGQNLTLGAQRLELAGSLEAGRDITLQGWSRQLSAANYTVGGYLFTQNLHGQGIDLLIPHENVILANGDVRFTQNYVGESLHVLAGGQVSRAAGANNITITGTSGGSVTQQIATGTGGLQAVTVTASDQPTVDIRSGVDWSQLTGGLLGNSNTSAAAVTFGVATGDSIALRNITNNGGDIALWAAGDITANNLDTSTLSTLFSTSSRDGLQGEDGGTIYLIADKDISLNSINSSSYSGAFSFDSNVTGGDGGSVYLIARDNIRVRSVDSSSNSNSISFWLSGDVSGGSGGTIVLAAEHDIKIGSLTSTSISIAVLDSGLNSSASSGDVIGGNGATVALVAGNSIDINSIDSSSFSYSYSYPAIFPPGSRPPWIPGAGNVTGGNGGAISLLAGTNIHISSIDSFSFSSSDSFRGSGNVTGDDGGAILLKAKNGGILTLAQADQFFDDLLNPSFQSFSVAEGGEAGSGGNVILEAATQIGSQNRDYPVEILTLSSSAQSGTVQITGLGENLDLLNTAVITSKAIEVENLVSNVPITIPVGETGQSGNVNISGIGNLTFTNSSFLSDTNGSDPAGNVTIRTPGSITFNNSSIETNTQSTGTAGDIDIRAASLTLDSRSQITAVTRSSGQAGNIRLRPYGNGQMLSINLSGEDSLISSSSLLPDDADTTFNGTEVTGQGGSIFISAPAAVTIQGEGDLKVETETSGNAGRLEINAPRIVVDGVEVSASSELPDLLTDELSENAISQVRANYQSGRGGSIEINTRELILRDRAEITADTSTLGRGGNLVVQNIGGPLTIRGDGQLTVSASGANSGRAGTLEINASDLLSLLDGIELTASSESINGGGEIDITVDGSLFMAGDSVINASASNPNAGDGGNITINLIDGLLIAPPGQNNDIIANAAGGNGGKITITALGIYGFTLQDISDVEVLRSNSTNDISASSNTGVDGEITLNTFELDLSQLSELPANLLDASGLAEQSLCQAGVGSEFVVTGRGGLPSTPIDALSSTATWEDWSIDSSSAESTSTLNDQALGTGAIAPLAPLSPSAPVTNQPIIEAQGWTRTADGRVALVVDPATVNPDSDQLIAQDCRQLRQVVSSETSSPQPETLATAAGTSDNP